MPIPRPPRGRTRTKQDLTQGSVTRQLIGLSAHGALTNLFSYSSTMINLIWLGRLGPESVAAVSTFQYIWFVFSLLNQAVGNGSVTLIARAYGSGNLRQCRRVFGQTFTFKLAVAMIVLVVGLLTARWTFKAFGSTDEVTELGVIYSTIHYLATPLMFSTFTLKTGFRAVGDMRRLFYISLATALINLVLDPFLIFPQLHIGPWPALGWDSALILPGLGLGVAGAAWATVIAFAITFSVSLYMFLSGRTFIRVSPRYFTEWSWDTARKLLRIGAPPALGDSLTNIANVFIGAAINTYGTNVFAAQGVNQSLLRFVRMGTLGIMMSAITMVGQNLGAGKPERAEKSVWRALWITSAITAVVAALGYVFAPQLARVFLPGSDPDTLEAMRWTVHILRINCFMSIPFAMSRIVRSAFEGSGYTKPSLWVTAGTIYGILLPVVLLGAYVWRLESPDYIWWTELIAYCVAVLALVAIFKRGKWKDYEV